MSHPAYTRRLVSATVASATDATASRYTVPAGRIAVVRSVTLWAEAPGVVLFGHFPQNIIWHSSQGLGQYLASHWNGRMTVNAGELLGAQWVSGGKIHVLATGYLLNA